jgi:hypothetical protein
MYTDLALIEDAIPQQTFLEMLGGHLMESKGKLKLETPRGIVTLYSKGFVADDPSSNIMFGGYLDLMLMSIWNQSEEKAQLWSKVFKLLRKEYEDRTSLPMPDEIGLGFDLFRRRTVFDVIKNALQGNRDNLATLAAKELLEKEGLGNAAGIMILTRADIPALSYMFDKSSLSLMFARKDWLIARPIWSSIGVLSGFQSLLTGETLGFQKKTAEGLTGDPRVMSLADSIQIAEDIREYPTSSKVVITSPDADIIFGNAEVVQWRSNIEQLKRINRVKFNDLRIRTKKGELSLLDAVWQDFVKSPRLKEAYLFLLAREHKDEILNRLRDADLQETYQNLRRAVPDQVMHQDKSQRLVARNMGYYAESDDGSSKRITNFQVEVKNLVSFKESNDTLVEMKIMSSADLEGLDITIPYDTCNSIDKLHKAIHKSWVMCTIDGNGVPQIEERGSAAKLFVTWLQQQASLKPQVLGVSRLGWSDDRTRFSAPYFEVTAERGVQLSTRKMHPHHDIFHSFDATPQTLGPLTNQLPLELADFISQMVAMICRFKTGYTVKPVGVLNCPASQKTLDKLFRALGQKVPIILNTNQRQGVELPGIGGYPVYGSGYSVGQLRSSKIPGFVLMDDGFFPIGSQSTDKDIGIAAALLPTLISKVTEYLLIHGNHEYERIRSLVYEHELRMEGANIICKACGMLEWPVSQMPYINFETILRSIPYSETENYFEYDFPNQIIRINLDQVQAKFSTSDLLVELSSLMKRVEMKNGHVELDAPSAGTILSDFYQNQVNYNTQLGEESKASSE